MVKVTDEQKKEFQRLATALSPENLTCDGEITVTQARKKAKILRAQWQKLEEKVGRSVSEDEVWDD